MRGRTRLAKSPPAWAKRPGPPRAASVCGYFNGLQNTGRLSVSSRTTVAGAAMVAAGLAGAVAAAPQETIRVGQTMPYSGPASAYGEIGRTQAACFDMINAEGGINGRRLELISLDDAYSPAKTVEQTRRLVEGEDVLFMFQSLGTPTNSAVHEYLNRKGVPQLFVAAGASKWGDPEGHPWTIAWQPSYRTEAQIYAGHIRETRPEATIAVLYQNDDYGRDYLEGFREGLGDMADRIVAELPYDTTDPTVDSQVIQAKASGADVFFNVATNKFAAQAIRKAHDIGWKPLHFLNSVAHSKSAVLEPAGLEAATGVITAGYQMDPTDPQWSDHPDVREWEAFMASWHPEGDRATNLTPYAWGACMTLKRVLQQAGDDLSRENIMAQAASLRQVRVPMLLPGIEVDTSPTDYFPIEAMQLQRFDGQSWRLFGEVISAETD